MGQAHGKQRLRRKHVEDLANNTIFNPHEIVTLYERFMAISASIDNDGVIDPEEFRRSLGMFSVFALRRSISVALEGDAVGTHKQ